jgi:betaine-aldehyde dehydrogenase
MSRSTIRNVINGKQVEADHLDHQDLIDPATGATYLSVPVSDRETVDAAMRSAADAFQTWRLTTPAERQRALLRFADAIEARETEISAAELRHTGSRAAAGEVLLAADQLRFFAGAARLLEGRSAGEYVAGHTSYVRREPLGVCAQLAPWNYPFMMAALKSAPALAAGNTVVLKPAETTPSTSLMFAEIAAEVLPPGTVNVICGGAATGRLMVEHPTPGMVSLTGSIPTGIDVAQRAGGTVKRAHLELGGKTPVVVCADADLTAVVDGVVTGAFTNAGQDCTAASRILVADEIHDELVERLVSAVAAIRPGPPGDEGAFYGPLNNADQLDRLAGYLNRLPAHATVVTGGTQVGDAGYYFAPTVIVNVREGDEVSNDELFGPVVTVQRFGTEDEAVELANGVSQGLASSVWTQSNARAMQLSRKLDFGCVWVNTHLMFPSEMPHGGFKSSGYGKDLSVYGFEDYTRLKHVMHRFE